MKKNEYDKARSKQLREIDLQRVETRFAGLTKEQLLRKVATLSLTARGYYRELQRAKAALKSTQDKTSKKGKK